MFFLTLKSAIYFPIFNSTLSWTIPVLVALPVFIWAYPFCLSKVNISSFFLQIDKSLKKEFFKESNTHSTCPWKGYASYFTVEVNGTTNKDAAWYYPDPSDKAKEIKDYVAFWNGVKIIE